MLHHGYVTVGDSFGNVHLAVFDVLELDLLVLLASVYTAGPVKVE